MSALRLFGITRADDAPTRRSEDSRPDRRAAHETAPSDGRIVFRNLVALVKPSASARPALADDDVRAHHATLAAALSQRGVLPAPAGTVFRSETALMRWLELHVVTLGDALDFVENRLAARVHVGPRETEPGVAGAAVVVDGTPSDTAGDTFRALRRHAAASVTLAGTPSAASASFLVEREHWHAFVAAAAEEDTRSGALSVRVTGPWPAYDFVRMQFGG